MQYSIDYHLKLMECMDIDTFVAVVYAHDAIMHDTTYIADRCYTQAVKRGTIFC